MLEAQVAVDVARRDLAGVDRADHRGRAGLAVTSREHAVEPRHLRRGVGHDAPPLRLDAMLLERLRVDRLANGHHHALAGDGHLRLVRRTRRRTAPLHLADDLGLHHEPVHLAVLADGDAQRRVKLQQLAALRLGAGNLLVLCGHVRHATAVDDGDLLRAAAHARARDVHRDVAAAHDAHALSGVVGHLSVAHGPQHLHGGLDAVGVLALEPELLVGVGADRQVHGIVLLAQCRDVRHGRVELDVDAAVQDPPDLVLQALAREPVRRDAVAQHAAKVVALLQDRDVVPHEREVVGAAQAGRAAAHDGDPLSGGLRHAGGVVPLHVLARVALDGADVHRVVHHAAAAVHLARVLAHEAADQGQRVVLPDEPHGVGVPAGAHERDVARDVDAGRASGHARHELGLRKPARALRDVVNEVVVEAADGLQRHRARLVADGAVGGQVDAPREPLDVVQRLHGGLAGEHVRQHVPKHPQAHAARRALSAALRRAHVDEGHRELHRARRQRAHRKAPTNRIVQLVHDLLRLTTFHYVHSCHSSPNRGKSSGASTAPKKQGDAGQRPPSITYMNSD